MEAPNYPAAEAASYDPDVFEAQLNKVTTLVQARARSLPELPVSSSKQAIEHALETLPASLPVNGLGLEQTTRHLLETISPALMPAQSGPRCFGLILGGVTPASHLAESIVTSFDPCVQVHFPEATASVAIEALTLDYLLTLLSLPRATFDQNTLTTGATSSNFLGLALGRNFAIAAVKARQGIDDWSVSDDGFGGVEVDVFVVDAHASVRKAAALAGLGRRNVHEVGSRELEERGYWCSFDLVELEARLKANFEKGRGSIVATSFGEVNSGAIASDTPAVRALCDKYSAWLHCDAAFAAFAILHPDFEQYTPHLALADSVCSDAHKWLNVPYDCGLFFSRKRPIPLTGNVTSLFDLTGPGSEVAAYLASSTNPTSIDSPHPFLDASRQITSPLFMNIENSRRFRALPLYASLLSLGIEGYRSLIQRNVSFARRIDAYLRSHPSYDVLTPPYSPASATPDSDPFAYQVANIVLFAPSPAAPSRYRVASAESPDPAATFLAALNASRDVFVTGTKWRGRNAVRIAVSNWMTDERRDAEIVERVLDRVMR